MNKKIPLWIAVSVGLIFSALVMMGTMFYAAYSYGMLNSGNQTTFISKIQEISQKVSLEFYKEVDTEKLQDAAIKGFMAGLEDKYAAYYSAEESKTNTADMEGKNVGLGINFLVEPQTGYLYVERVHEHSPANGVLFSGDRITSLNGTEVNAENYVQLVKQIGESANSPVAVTVLRAGNEVVDVQITPAEYASQSVWWETIDATAYIFISEFDDTTPEQLKAAMEHVAGAESIIFDLRGNPGGTVKSVGSSLDYLLPSGDLIVATYKDGSSSVLQTSDAQAALTIPAVVVVDNETASSGEVFALAMRDIYNAPVVGETTFGKGVMQTTYSLQDGSSYKFSTATITSHSRTEYNGVGVVPDVTLKPEEEEKIAAKMGPIKEDPVIKMALELLSDSEEE